VVRATYNWPPTNGNGGLYLWRRSHLPKAPEDLSDATEWLVYLACFRPDERAIIEAAPGLYELITSQPRIRWHEVFDAHQQTARHQDKILKKLTGKLKGSAPTYDHPYVNAALAGVVEDVAKADGVTRPQNSQLYVSSARSGNILAGAGCESDGEEVQQQTAALIEAICSAKVLDPHSPWDSRAGRKKARDTIDSGMQRGFENPLDLSELSAASARQTDRKPSNEKPIRQTSNGHRVAEVIRFSEVKAKPIDWLWRGWIAKRSLSMLVGDPGVGKS
jgi:hypothetical protein